jgi:apolipoprotein N-acyltransferase
LKSTVEWLFRDPKSGEFVIGQPPNTALLILVVASICRLIFQPSGVPGVLVGLITAGALVWWSSTEVHSGVNPFRRILGASVFAIAATAFLVQIL